MDSSLRRVIIVTETPESRQPYSMMHRALYANIVGHETLYSFPHGCTIKQYNGDDYIVDHVTRLARPVSLVPALTAHNPDLVRKAGEYENGITKCQAVLNNLESRIRIATNQLEVSNANADRHEAVLKARQQAQLAPPGPIAAVISQRCQDLTTVRSLLSLVAQALRFASSDTARSLKPHQIAELERVSPPLHLKYVQWRSGEITLLEKSDTPLNASLSHSAHPSASPAAERPGDGDDAEYPNAEESQADALAMGYADYNDDDAMLEGSEDGDYVDEANPEHGDAVDGDGEDMPVVEDAAVEEDPDMVDDIVIPGAKQDASATTTVVPPSSVPVAPAETIAIAEQPPTDAANDSLAPPSAEEAIAVPVAEVAPAAMPSVDSATLCTEVAADLPPPVATTSPTKAAVREPFLYLPECGQPDICVYCAQCMAYIPYTSEGLAAHDASPAHAEAQSSKATAATSEFSTPHAPLPSYVTNRPVPKRHVRVEDDNTFSSSGYAIVRSGCTSCRRDVGMADIVAHGESQEHLDFLDE